MNTATSTPNQTTGCICGTENGVHHPSCAKREPAAQPTPPQPAMKNTYALTMANETTREVEADFMTIENGHYVFGQSFVGPFRTIAMSQVHELSTHPNRRVTP